MKLALPRPRSAARSVLSALALITSLAAPFAPAPAHAEGSATLLQSGGYRPFLEYRNDFTQNSSLRRKTVVKVYANAGDTLLLGSSANGVGRGAIRWVAPDGATGTVPGTTGIIPNRIAEIAGPNFGYTPARVAVGAGRTGIWEIHFVSPDSTNDFNPPEITVGANWSQPSNVGYVCAFDVTVHNSAGAIVNGRAYVNQLAMNVGGPVANLSSQFWILTRDGFRYRLDANGVQPFGFNLFANNKGFTDGNGIPLYHSVDLSGANVHDPDALDTPADVTHKIFFNIPSNDLPASALSPSGSTWLRLASPIVPTVSDLTFVGADGTPNQAGSGLGGFFHFTASGNGNYVLRIDLDGNGNYFDPIDRTLSGTAVPGLNTVVWDGRNGLGQRALASGNPSFVSARVQLLGGEVHFPYIDAENNTQGMILERQVGAFAPDDTLYYDDRPVGGAAALPPVGENSVAGGHKWSSFLGDVRGMDTWTYVPGITADLNIHLLIRDADLELVSKQHAPDPFLQGAPMTWTIVARNNGPDSIFAATVLDTMPAAILAPSVGSQSTLGGTQIASAAFTGQIFRATLSVMPPNGTATFVLAGTVAPNATGPLVNRALALRGPDQGDADDPIRIGAGNNSKRDTARVAIVAPDLAITKGHTGSFVVSQNATWTISVRNGGTGPTTGAITVTDTLPAGNTFVSGSGTGWTITNAGAIVTATNPGPLAVGATSNFNVTVTVGAAAVPTTTNFATVRTPGDSNPSNDRDGDTAPVASTADLALFKSHAAPFAVGANGVWTLTVRNLGPGATSGSFSVSDTLPAGTSYVNGVGQNWIVVNNGNVVLATYSPVLPAGGEASFTLTVAVDPAAYPSVTNFATVRGPNDPNPGNDRGNDPTPVTGLADLTIDKRHTQPFTAPGTGQYRLVITNIGNIATAGAVTVTDTLPNGLTYVSSVAPGFTVTGAGRNVSAVTNHVFTPGDSLAIDLTVAVATAAVPGVVNTAAVNGGGDGNPFNNTDSDPTPVNGTPDLAIDKSHNGTFTVGLPANYRIEVRNVGTVATTGTITVRDTLPNGLTFTGGSGAGWNFSANDAVVTAISNATLVPSANSFFILTVDVGAAAVPGVTNAAVVNTPGDVNPGNDRDTDPTPVNGLPDLAIAKSHTGEFSVGGEGTYLLVVRNVGAGPTLGTVTVSDTLPAGLTYARPASANGWTLTWNPPLLTATNDAVLAVAQSESLSFVVAIGPAAIPSVLNVAQVGTPGDGNPDNDRASDRAPVAAKLAMSLEKLASPQLAEIGDVIEYTLRLRNDGDVPLSAITVDDRLPRGFVYLTGSARLDGAPLADPAGSPGPQLAFAVPSLAIGQTSQLRYRVAIGAGAVIGQGVNVAIAHAGGGTGSNEARAAVDVRGGVFADEGIIVGKVFTDCDCAQDRSQGPEELGVPGVRLYLEDGTSAVTDAEGKYHFDDVRPRLHVVRIDATTLPPGAKLVALDARNARDPLSRFVDLQKGELHRADFAIAGRDTSVQRYVKLRRELGEVTHAMHESPEGMVLMPSTAPAPETLRLRPIDKPAPADGEGATVTFAELPDSALARSPRVTFETDHGRFVNTERRPARDADPVTPGLQKALGTRTLTNGAILESPDMPGIAHLRATLDDGRSDSATVKFVPASRPLFLSGVIDGVLDWRGKKDSQLNGPRDAFEDRLTDASFDSDSGRVHGAARGALFAKGDVAKLGLLTLRYDSELDPNRRLFRDITPEQGYDVFGDASLHGFDAQSRSRLYARLDHGASYAMFGDLATESSPLRRLGAFDRSLNGGQAHAEGHGFSLGGFVSEGRSHQQIDELRGLGVSGPYALTRTDGVQGSERVELVTRDRNQPDRILRRVTLVRFADYTLEPLTGRLIFRQPVPSVDGDFDPVSIRVTYEVEGGAKDYWVYGVNAGTKLGPAIDLGLAANRDEDPSHSRELVSGDIAIRIAPGATFTGEAARSDSAFGGLDKPDHAAARGEFAFARGRTQLRAWGSHVERAFDNASAGVTSGEDQLGASARLPLLEGSNAFATALRNRSLVNDDLRQGVDAGLTQKLGGSFVAEGALRWAQTVPGVASGSPALESHSLRGKLTAMLPHHASLFGEYEQDMDVSTQKRTALGAEVQVAPRTHLYARHEDIASFDGPFAFDKDHQVATSVIGIRSDELREGSLFTEYRARDAFAGRDAEAAIGVRNRWAIAHGVRLDGSFERVASVRGLFLPTGGDTPATLDQTAVTGGIEFTRDPRTKATARLEWRGDHGRDRWFGTAGLGRKLSQDWTLLTRTTIVDAPDEGQTDALSRFGLAYRQTDDDHWNALGRYEHHLLKSGGIEPTRTESHVVSAHANWRPVRPWILTGRLAGRWLRDTRDGFTAHTNTDLAATRVTWEFTQGWDANASARGLFSRDFKARRSGLGIELGHTLARQLRAAVGWNAFGFHDADMSGVDRTDAGAYVRLGFKFDESLFGVDNSPPPVTNAKGGDVR